MFQLDPGRLLDAYTSHNGSVVTRAWQDNDTQVWCFTLDADDGIDSYRIQHRTYSGQYLDAYESCCDYDVVLRDFQDNLSQRWYVLASPNIPASTTTTGTTGSTGNNVYVRLQQASSNRYLDAYTTSSDNYQAVTRSYQSNSTQDWLLFH
jgi:hypothetical protein